MDDTMKKYEHRHLAMSVCEHKCNVGEKYVLPQAKAFGLSWSTATVGLADIHNNSWGRTMKKKCSDPTRMDQVSMLKCHPWIGMLTHTLLKDL